MGLQIVDAALPLAGGALIGLASALYLATHGRIAGVSGMVSGALEGAADRASRAWFLLGLIIAGGVVALALPALFERSRAPLLAMNVSVATIDLTERRLVPHTPCPLVQPLPSRVPKPTSNPATTTRR